MENLSTITLSDAQVQQFRTEGYLITDVLFDSTTLDGLKREFDRLWQQELQALEQLDETTAELVRLRPFLGQVHCRSELCARFVRGPVFQEICRTLIGPDADLYFNQAVMKPPGKGKPFGWHQDSQYIITEPLEYVTCWIAVGNATIENGTIWIVPGMHRHGLLPHRWSDEAREWQCQFDDSQKIPVELRAGQMAVFNSLLPHSSGPNVSSETRYAYVPQYHVAGVRKRDDGELTGDQFPLLRNGLAVGEESPA